MILLNNFEMLCSNFDLETWMSQDTNILVNIFFALNVIEGLGVLLMFKPFLGVKKEKTIEQSQ